jgi:hypothetical protein
MWGTGFEEDRVNGAKLLMGQGEESEVISGSGNVEAASDLDETIVQP